MPAQNTQRSQHSNAAMTSIVEISWTLLAFSDQFDSFFLTSSECLLQQIMQLLRWPEYRKLISFYSWDWWITVFWARDDSADQGWGKEPVSSPSPYPCPGNTFLILWCQASCYPHVQPINRLPNKWGHNKVYCKTIITSSLATWLIRTGCGPQSGSEVWSLFFLCSSQSSFLPLLLHYPSFIVVYPSRCLFFLSF